MRVSKEKAAAHRGAIVTAAGRLFRRRGFAGVAVAEITREAGLTHGGFYGHFASKEALAAEAIAAAFAEGLARLDAAPDLPTYLRGYLSRSHRDHPEDGCVMAALSADVGRCGDAAEAAWAEGVEAFVDRLTRRLRATSRDEEAARRRATAVLSMMVGGLALARTLARGAPETSTRMLAALRAEAMALVEGTDATATPGRSVESASAPAPSNR